MRIHAALLGGLLVATPAVAGDLAVSVKTTSGKPVADAVVMVAPQGARRAVQVGGPYRMAQKDMSFQPFVLVVPLGAEVAFPNLDPVRHHVYSFSAAKPFELKLYGRDETRRVRFDKVGVVAVGCNIHDAMSGYIRVVDTPFAAKTNASGEVLLHDLPAGGVMITIWHPYLKAPRNEAARPMQAPAQGTARQAFVVDLRAPPMHHGAY
jgi:plastocyanin